MPESSPAPKAATGAAGATGTAAAAGGGGGGGAPPSAPTSSGGPSPKVGADGLVRLQSETRVSEDKSLGSIGTFEVADSPKKKKSTATQGSPSPAPSPPSKGASSGGGGGGGESGARRATPSSPTPPRATTLKASTSSALEASKHNAELSLQAQNRALKDEVARLKRANVELRRSGGASSPTPQDGGDGGGAGGGANGGGSESALDALRKQLVAARKEVAALRKQLDDVTDSGTITALRNRVTELETQKSDLERENRETSRILKRYEVSRAKGGADGGDGDVNDAAKREAQAATELKKKSDKRSRELETNAKRTEEEAIRLRALVTDLTKVVREQGLAPVGTEVTGEAVGEALVKLNKEVKRLKAASVTREEQVHKIDSTLSDALKLASQMEKRFNSKLKAARKLAAAVTASVTSPTEDQTKTLTELSALLNEPLPSASIFTDVAKTAESLHDAVAAQSSGSTSNTPGPSLTSAASASGSASGSAGKGGLGAGKAAVNPMDKNREAALPPIAQDATPKA